jgi:uncharacterized lipoprotein YbaY
VRVHGQVHLPAGASPPPSSALILRIEDIAEADAPARVLFRQEIPVPHAGPLAFDFEFQPPEGGCQCILTARIATEDASKVVPSDYITTRAYSLHTDLPEQTFDIALTRAA